MIDKLHYISQPAKDGSHLTAIENALTAGCKWVQLRIKNEPHEQILECARKAQELCKFHNASLIINDNAEIAMRAGAYGVHLGLQDMPVKKARDLVSSNMIIGGTANTFEHILKRVKEGADYIGLGPFRFTSTKQKLSPVLGLQGFEQIMEQVQLAKITMPIIAIGGILPEDIEAIMKTGVYGIAASGAITFAENPTETIMEMYRQIQKPAVDILPHYTR